MELVANTFKLEKSLNQKMLRCAKTHRISKSEFIRQAIIDHVQDLLDLDAFEHTKNDSIYSLKAVEKAIGMED